MVAQIVVLSPEGAPESVGAHIDLRVNNDGPRSRNEQKDDQRTFLNGLEPSKSDADGIRTHARED